MNKDSYGLMVAGNILLLLLGSMVFGHGFMGFGMGIGFVLMILFWVAVIWLIVGLASEKSDKDSLEIIKERYAKGEITKKRFEQMKKGIT